MCRIRALRKASPPDRGSANAGGRRRPLAKSAGPATRRRRAAITALQADTAGSMPANALMYVPRDDPQAHAGKGSAEGYLGRASELPDESSSRVATGVFCPRVLPRPRSRFSALHLDLARLIGRALRSRTVRNPPSMAADTFSASTLGGTTNLSPELPSPSRLHDEPGLSRASPARPLEGPRGDPR